MQQPYGSPCAPSVLNRTASSHCRRCPSGERHTERQRNQLIAYIQGMSAYIDSATKGSHETGEQGPALDTRTPGTAPRPVCSELDLVNTVALLLNWGKHCGLAFQLNSPLPREREKYYNYGQRRYSPVMQRVLEVVRIAKTSFRERLVSCSDHAVAEWVAPSAKVWFGFQGEDRVGERCTEKDQPRIIGGG